MQAPADLRSVMRRFPSGVAVLTVDVDGQRLGLTVSSLAALSLDPPLAGVAVSRQAAMHELLREAGRFALSLLAEGQERLAQHFARGVPPLALWEGVELLECEGPPLLAGALGWLVCALRDEVAAGSHTLFVGEAVSAELGAPARALVRVRGEWLAA